MLCGGSSNEKPVDDEIKTITDTVREEAQSKAQAQGWNGLFEEFTPVRYTSQVVAGTVFKIKVKTSATAYAHVKVFRPLPHTGQGPQVSEIEVDKLETDAL